MRIVLIGTLYNSGLWQLLLFDQIAGTGANEKWIIIRSYSDLNLHVFINQKYSVINQNYSVINQKYSVINQKYSVINQKYSVVLNKYSKYLDKKDLRFKNYYFRIIIIIIFIWEWEFAYTNTFHEYVLMFHFSL